MSRKEKDLQWEKLSPAEFQQLQDLQSYSSKKLQDVLDECSGTGPLSRYCLEDDIDFEGFRLFMDTYLEAETPEELCKHLFLSFVKTPHAKEPGGSDEEEEGAAAAAAVSSPTSVRHVGATWASASSLAPSRLAERLGLADRERQARASDAGARPRTGTPAHSNSVKSPPLLLLNFPEYSMQDYDISLKTKKLLRKKI
ncbi:diacylglycerol kinase gamma-like [Schistocerca serialis cubense]|uniref:diacylglycerol kinase gamma-like n=1 Tax=Schistocerca serialis cubense TaxID=2023355 RepID=UPI00214E8BBD|nr:diacylglycerol kinase gamma-like [Schistocerca serialis cubense]